MSVDDLVASFRQLGYDTVSNDVSVILESYKKMLERLDFSMLIVRPGEFQSLKDLYDKVIRFLLQISDGDFCMMELMPYIDDYLEYYDGISEKLMTYESMVQEQIRC